MKLHELEPGRRFRLPDTGKTGALVSVGDSGARVLYDGARTVREFQVRSGDEVVGDVAFESPGRPVIISAGTEVDPL